MNWEEILSDHKLWKKIRGKLIFFISFTVGLIFILFHIENVSNVISYILSLFGPLLVGIGVAYVVNVLVRFIENKLFAPLNKKGWKLWLKMRRGISILLAFSFLSLVVWLFIIYIVPEFISSLSFFSENLPAYINQFSQWLTELANEFDWSKETQSLLKVDWTKPLEKVTQTVSDLATSLVSATISIASGIISFVLSVIFSIYILFSKERLIRNIRRVLYAFFPKEKAQRLVAVGVLTNRTFSGFVTGQMTEAIIIGSLCYLGMSVMGLPYAIMISVIISMTSLVPILGAYLGGAIGAFVLLMINPFYSLWFLIFLVLLQQFEGNVIYPRVVGSSIGLPGLWVMIAILLCGNLFGIIGILLGVPLFSVFYALLRQETELKLKEREITEEEVMGKPPVVVPEIKADKMGETDKVSVEETKID
ncbi:MAG: AI-2E family transporter [Clostridium sp.]|uniref:AI-2E family transporter n=1 Tax=Clostridium sp. TaxID=1506 RepID=UPI00291295CD|nr:AI-2E family transporter [Clostridium sp.]MDU7337321.1 AI-2E family transporter [Clostridium sp.]